MLPGPRREPFELRVGRAQFAAEPVRLFGVVADELVGFPALLEPGPVTLVEVGAPILRDPGIGDVTDRGRGGSGIVVLAGRATTKRADRGPRRSRTINLLSRLGELFGWSEVHDGASREVPSDDGGALDQGPIAGLEAVELLASSASIDGGTVSSASGRRILGQIGEELLEEERVSFGDRDDASSERVRELLLSRQRGNELLRLVRR